MMKNENQNLFLKQSVYAEKVADYLVLIVCQ